jgi:hypothetical protein
VKRNICLIILIEIIFLILRVHKTKNSFEKIIKEISSKDLIDHLNQFKQLDEYLIKCFIYLNLFVLAKSIVIKSLKENYFLQHFLN